MDDAARRRRVVDIVRGDRWQAALIGQPQQPVCQRALLRQRVVPHFHGDVAGIELPHEIELHPSAIGIARPHAPRQLALRAAGERQQPGGVLRQIVPGHARTPSGGRAPSPRDELRNVGVALGGPG